MITERNELLSSPHDKEEHWLSVSDLMAGLMMVFLMISVIYMVKVEAEKQKVTEVAVVYQKLREELYDDLYQEFEKDLPEWGANINKDTLAFTFNEPEILFQMGSADLRPRFKEILTDFFPRYLSLITSEKYVNDIEEVRIEGHTSSRWSSTSTEEESYFKNMELSQARTRTTLQYVLGLPRVNGNAYWLRSHLTANGLSFARRVYEDGQENYAASRRVEFKVRTNAERKIAKILEVSAP